MKSEWEIIERLFHAACELRPEDRKGFLVRECGQNVAVREKVEALLREHEKPTEFLNAPAAEMVAWTLIAGSVLGPYQIIEVAGAEEWDRFIGPATAVFSVTLPSRHFRTSLPTTLNGGPDSSVKQLFWPR